MSNQSRGVLVTGVSSGIGREIVLACLRRGHRVSGCARRADRLDALTTAAGADGARLHTFVADVTQAAEVAAWIAAASARLGRIDTLINNAGYGHNGPFEELSADDFREQFETNFFAVVEVTRQALPLLHQAGGGDVVMISSILGHVALAGRAPYCASKWALEGLAEALRQELRPKGIRVSVVNPGFTETEFHDAQKVRGARPALSRFSAMPAARVAKVVVDTLGRTRRRVVLTGLGRVGFWAHRLLPALFDRAGERAFYDERERVRRESEAVRPERR